MDFAHHRDIRSSELDSTSHDEYSGFQPSSFGSASAVPAHEFRNETHYHSSLHEPLSPPPTLTLNIAELPPADLCRPHHSLGLSSPESPRRDCGDFFQKPCKRLRLLHEDDTRIGTSGNVVGHNFQISKEAHGSSVACTPNRTWGSQSRSSDDSSTAYSPYDHEDTHSLQWSSPMDSSPTSSLFQDDDFNRNSPPSSPRPKLVALDLPAFDDFRGPSIDEIYDPEPPPKPFPYRPSRFTPHHTYPEPLGFDVNERSPDPDMDIDSVDPRLSPPSSPPSGLLALPVYHPLSDTSFANTVMPPDDDDVSDDTPQPHSPMPRQFQPLPDFDTYDDSTYLTPVPCSPRGRPALLPLFTDSLEPPPSPSSPHQELSPLPEDSLFFSQTCVKDQTGSPSSIAVQPSTESEGLGLFIRSIDPPLARTPSPTEDDFGFLDIQLDPASSHLEVDEFLALRRMRKQALEFEKNARLCEEELSERVTAAACALYPLTSSSPGSSSSSLSLTPSPLDPQTKRARKHELHAAMDARSEVRKQRKRSKQKSKEIGALLDYKMNRSSLSEVGVDVAKGLRHLVANMVMCRRDSSRALAGRKVASVEKRFVKTRLSASMSIEDLLEGLHLEGEIGGDEDLSESREQEEGCRSEGEGMDVDVAE